MKINEEFIQEFEEAKEQLLEMNPILSLWIKEAILCTLDIVEKGISEKLLDTLPLDKEDREEVATRFAKFYILLEQR